MKQTRCISLLLVLMLLTQLLWIPAAATDGADSSPLPVSKDAISAEEPEAEETAEPETETLKEGEISDSELFNINSVRGLNAKKPLSDENDIDFDGEALLLYELNTQTMAYAKNIDEKREPASLTKVMTCLLALEHGNLSDKITINEETFAELDDSSSVANLETGEVYTLEELIQCLMVKSANDAACVIAEHIGGTQENFIAMMNRKAEELGCTATSYANPHGLHDENHYTTARDMAIIMTAALEYPKFQEIYSMESLFISADDTRPAQGFTSTNYLISTAESDSYYDERVIGGKTGFTTPAGRCLVCVAELADVKYLVVVMGATAFDSQGYVLYSNFTTATEMLDYGFASYVRKQVITAGEELEVIPVSFGSDSAHPSPLTNVSALIPAQYDASQLYLEYDLPDDRLVAPIHKGDLLGTALMYYGEFCIGSTQIVSTTEIEVRSPEAIVTPDPEVEQEKQQEQQETDEAARNFVTFIVAIIGVTALILLILIIRASILRAIRQRRLRKKRERQRLEAQRLAQQRAQQRIRQQAQLRAYTQKQAEQAAYQQAQQEAQAKAQQQAFYQAQQRARQSQQYSQYTGTPQNPQYRQQPQRPSQAQQAANRQRR